MLFHMFCSQEERRAFGGSAFIEMQFCKLPAETKKEKLLALSSISHWKNDSIYIYLDDIDSFCQEYGPFLDCDVYGINYYTPSTIDLLIDKLNKSMPLDYEVLVSWLCDAKCHNGFYILGI